MAPPSTSNNIPLVILARSTVTTPDTSRTPMTSGAAPGLSDGRCKCGFHYRFSAAGIRSAKVTAKAFRAGFQRVTHRACGAGGGCTRGPMLAGRRAVLTRSCSTS